MSINLHLPAKNETLRPTITVIGVGGAGGNAVNNMVAAKLEGVNFVVANTDAQALDHAATQKRILFGNHSTRGLGAGADPVVGRNAADEAMDEIAEAIEGSNMLFITAGMGGGTGTGAAPVVAKLAREQGILTVGVVTKPFHFEGTHRMRLAEAGLQELQQYVDTLIVIPNQNLFRIANEKTTFADAFRMADEVLHSGVRGVTDLMVKPGLVNLDFADIRTVMREMGKAMMGTGEATGERRAIEAAEAAISNPLLDDVSLKGARAVLINITGGMDMTLYEVDEAANRIREEVDSEANIIFGSAFSEAMDGKMRVSVVATGIDAQSSQQRNAVSMGNANGQEARRPYTISAAARQEMKAMVRPQLVVAAMQPAPMTAAKPVSQHYEEAAQPDFGFEQDRFAEPTLMQSEAPPAPVSYAGPQLFSNSQAPRAESYAAPSAPTSYGSLAPAPAHNSASAAPRRSVRDSEPVATSFFQKVTGLGRAMAKPYHDDEAALKSDTRNMQVSERARVEAGPSAPEETDDRYLEIPAFLRRQAN